MKKFNLIFMTAALLSSAAFAASTVPVVSGGVGEESRQIIEAAKDTHNTKLLFTGVAGIYLSDVHVTVQDSKNNTLVDEISDGPIMMIDLPAGKYRVNAEASGFTKQASITAGQRLKSHQFTFPIKDEVTSSPQYQQEKLQDTRVENTVPAAAAPRDYDERHVLHYEGKPATLQMVR